MWTSSWTISAGRLLHSREGMGIASRLSEPASDFRSRLGLRKSRFLWLVLAVRLALGLTYALLVPPWEADNEDSHFAYARYLAVHRTLLQPGDPEAEAIWERVQPPLYYALIALVLSGLDLGTGNGSEDAVEMAIPNPDISPMPDPFGL